MNGLEVTKETRKCVCLLFTMRGLRVESTRLTNSSSTRFTSQSVDGAKWSHPSMIVEAISEKTKVRFIRIPVLESQDNMLDDNKCPHTAW
jgi:hypothetical protein